ncbi:hypothetical protein EK904_007833 [Melospiza melodia maxima]|nr:hypothetical protein EK904_007833 [Melospiza melodia maxima]
MEVLGSSTAPGNAPSRGNVIRGDRVPQEQQHVRVLNRPRGSCFFGLAGSCRRTLTQGLRVEVDVHGARDGVGHDQRRGRQVVGTDTVTQAALKVLGARQHPTGNEISLKGRPTHTAPELGVLQQLMLFLLTSYDLPPAQVNHSTTDETEHRVPQASLEAVSNTAALDSYLGDAENDVYGSGKGADGACELTAHHLRQGQRQWHSQHHCFCLDAPDACRDRGTRLSHLHSLTPCAQIDSQILYRLGDDVQAAFHNTKAQGNSAKALPYSGTGCRWKGQRMGVFSICAGKGPGLRPASHGPRQPLWPRHGGGFRSGGFSGDSRASGFCSPPPGLGAFWIALQHQTRHPLRHCPTVLCAHAPHPPLVLSATPSTDYKIASEKREFVYYNLAAKCSLQASTFSLANLSRSQSTLGNNSHPHIMQNYHEKSTAQQRQCRGFYLGIKRESAIYSHAKEFNTNSSKMFIASVSFTKKPSQLRTLDSNNTRMECHPEGLMTLHATTPLI